MRYKKNCTIHHNTTRAYHTIVQCIIFSSVNEMQEKWKKYLFSCGCNIGRLYTLSLLRREGRQQCSVINDNVTLLCRKSLLPLHFIIISAILHSNNHHHYDHITIHTLIAHQPPPPLTVAAYLHTSNIEVKMKRKSSTYCKK